MSPVAVSGTNEGGKPSGEIRQTVRKDTERQSRKRIPHAVSLCRWGNACASGNLVVSYAAEA